MDKQTVVPLVVAAVFAAVIGFMLIRFMRYGFKGAMFGARVQRAVGEATATTSGPISTVMRVHVLERGDPDRAVGIELFTKALLGYSMVPVTLSQSEARKLAALLQSAVQ